MKNTWDCKYCKAKRLDPSRNCQGKYSNTSIIINGDTLLTECPMSLASPECNLVYSIIKNTLMGEMGTSFLPSQLLNELNVLFIYRDTIQKAESACEKATK